MPTNIFRDHVIRSFDDNKHYFIIDDGTRWKVRDHYRIPAKFWKVGDKISLSGFGTGCIIVKNITQGDSIEARKYPKNQEE